MHQYAKNALYDADADCDRQRRAIYFGGSVLSLRQSLALCCAGGADDAATDAALTAKVVDFYFYILRPNRHCHHRR